jgi:hypothetical protein
MRSLFVPFVVAFGAIAAACSSSSSNDQPDTSPGDTGFGLESGGETDTNPPADGGGFSEKLSQTSLYKDWGTKAIADDAVMFRPAYELWADALKKRRWIELPAGAKIDTSDMDNWVFPIGTKFWKEFAVDGGKILETRLIERTGPNPADYRMGAYVWNDAQTEAMWSQTGDTNVLGTDHDVPDLAKCQACHNAAPGKINGFQAIQMTKPTAPGPEGQVNLAWLIAQSWLSAPPSVDHFDIPGDATAQAALGYLHANCGHCHNPRWEFFALTNQVLRLTIDSIDTVENTNTYKTTYYQHTKSFKDVPWRLQPATSDMSCIYVRPTHRGDSAQMPPIATKHVDDTGTAAIKAWIDSLPAAPPPPDDAGVDSGPDSAPGDAGPGD